MKFVLKSAIEPGVSQFKETIYTSREVVACIEVSKSVLMFDLEVLRINRGPGAIYSERGSPPELSRTLCVRRRPTMP